MIGLAGIPGCGLSGMAAFGDISWLVSEIDAAKTAAGRTGNVDAARRQIQKAFDVWQNANGGATSPEYGAAFGYYSQAMGYVESFRPGSDQIARGYASASGAEAARLEAGTAPIDTGSGNVVADVLSGTFSDLTVLNNPFSVFTGGGQGAVGGRVSDMTGGVPGETVGGRAQSAAFGGGSGPAPIDVARKAKCEALGGRWNQEAQTCVGAGDSLCVALPQPLRWVCENPGKSAAIGTGIVLAPWIVPWFVRLVAGTASAVGEVRS